MVWSLTVSVVLFRFRGLNVVVVGVLMCLLGMASWHFANAFKPEKKTYMHSRRYTSTTHAHSHARVQLHSSLIRPELSQHRSWITHGFEDTQTRTLPAQVLNHTRGWGHSRELTLSLSTDVVLTKWSAITFTAWEQCDSFWFNPFLQVYCFKISIT